MAVEQFDTSKMYLTIVGGTLAQKVDETTEGAKRREYEASDGTKGEKWEVYYKNVSGLITNIEIKESKFGDQAVILIQDGEDKYQLQIGTGSKYFTDFGRKISNIHLDMDVVISPYDFETDGKRRTGLSIKQEGQKVVDFFWDGKKTVNGFPQPEGDTKKYKSDDWTVYFLSVKKFLTAHVEKVWAEQQEVEADAVDF